jgi:acyl carrier protein
VMAREDDAQEKHLTAYVVAKAGSRLTDKDVREQLAGCLPQHMIPEVFVRIDSLPLNGNGKIDRCALPIPDDSNCLHLDSYVAPRTPFEERIAKILAPLLGLGKVSVDENFFLLGGHSLLGTQLIARMRQIFGVELSLRTLFDCSTIATLSNEIERLLYLRLEAMSEEEADRFLKEVNEEAPEGV